ncbi:uncharacterized protein LOC121736252 [Aricia agestis]|uniref:uncharacterized protein LOC121736252 n=1 Tax=Aricia agestis TaxID=91739 RepID=UPI001C201634|nr:uncharacterized protein LOC121736252 [Aricia agestis]
MIWILLFICFCNITNGYGDQKSSVLAKDKSKSGNSIARRILEEIKFRNVSKQKADILSKSRDFVTSATEKHESDTFSYISTTNDPLTVKETFENKYETERVNRNRNDQKPTEQATTIIPAAISVIPVSLMANQNVFSSTIRAKTENSMNNINNTEDITRTEKNPVEVATILNKFIESDEIQTTNSLREGIPITENDVNVTVIPLQVNNMDTQNITKQILRSKNNKETQNLSYLIAKLSHLQKVKSESNIIEEKNITKVLASNRNHSYLNSKKTDYSFESDNGTISGLINRSVKSIILNFSNNTIMLTFIKSLNIGLDKTNGFKGLGKLGAHNIGNEKPKQETTNAQECKNIINNIRSYVATENPIYDGYVSQSKNNYYRQLDKSKRMKDDVTPISVDYYFGRNENENEFDSDEVVDPGEEESVAILKNDYVAVNFDKDADAFGRSRNEVMLSVLRDMIKMDSKALVEYPWLKSVLEVRSGILKIIDLINSYVYNHKIHRLDLELLKYLLYLHKSSSLKLQISESSPYSRPQLSMNPIDRQVPILKNLFKNIKKDGSKSGSGNEEDQQLTIMFDLQDLMNEVLLLLESFHRKIQDLAQYDSKPTQLYHKLKDDLEYAEDQQLRVVLLHISLAKLFDYIDSSAHRVREGFYNYVQQHPDKVKRDQETAMTILNVLDELHWK